MKEISYFFDKFRNLLALDGEIKKILCLVLKKNISEEISQSNIKISKNILYLQVNSKIKNEVFIKKQQILSELKTLLGRRAPKDIF